MNKLGPKSATTNPDAHENEINKEHQHELLVKALKTLDYFRHANFALEEQNERLRDRCRKLCEKNKEIKDEFQEYKSWTNKLFQSLHKDYQQLREEVAQFECECSGDNGSTIYSENDENSDTKEDEIKNGENINEETKNNGANNENNNNEEVQNNGSESNKNINEETGNNGPNHQEKEHINKYQNQNNQPKKKQRRKRNRTQMENEANYDLNETSNHYNEIPSTPFLLSTCKKLRTNNNDSISLISPLSDIPKFTIDDDEISLISSLSD